VRPDFSSKGRVTISEAALSQMIMHCIDEYAPETSIRKVQVKNEPTGYRITVFLDVPFGSPLAVTLHNMQSYTIENIEKFTGIIIKELNIIVSNVTETPE
jgi:uncharacterized alkaline shock family protein YloU